MNRTHAAILALAATVPAAADVVTLCDPTDRTLGDLQSVQITLDPMLPPGGTINAVNVTLNVEHDWLGDLRITVEHAGVTRALIDSVNLGLYPYGCGGRDIDARFIDGAAAAASDLCVASATGLPPEPILTGDVRPDETLTTGGFAGLDPAGDWVVTITDLRQYDIGVIRDVCIEIDHTPAPPLCAADADGSGAVDFDDLNIILAAWGGPGPAGDVAPPGGDGAVNFDDLNAVLLAWGAMCP